MSMVTRCPICDTVFRVTPQQLQAQQGQVRCGRCMAVFDGFSTLATLPDQRPEEPEAKVSPARFTGDGDTRSQTAHAASAPPLSPEEQLAAGSAAAPETISDEVSRPAAAGVDSRAAADLAEHMTDSPPPEHSVEPAAANQPPSRAWAAAAALMALVLVAQAAYAYRGELVAYYPGLKPVFAGLCSVAGCRVPLPQRPERIVIEASDLQVQDQLRPGVIQLTATLRNHAGYEVGYPALDLVLTNTKEHALARRIFMPAEYLAKGENEASGLAAHAEVTVRLVLDTGDLGAAGFRLALLPAQP